MANRKLRNSRGARAANPRWPAHASIQTTQSQFNSGPPAPDAGPDRPLPRRSARSRPVKGALGLLGRGRADGRREHKPRRDWGGEGLQ